MTTIIGGIPVADPGDPPGALVTSYGHVQYGRVLAGDGSSVRAVRVHGWRNLPDADVADVPRPQAAGAEPGSVLGGSLTITVDYLIRGLPDAKAAAVDAFEQHHPQDGVERMLALDDGTGTWFRWARVVAREVPQEKHYRHGPVEVSVQYLCADPRRYRLQARSVSLSLPAAAGGLAYPLAYPLEYGLAVGTARQVVNDGGTATPLSVAFVGPLTNPQLQSPLWGFGFDLTLASGEVLTVDTADGTALLDGADRMGVLRPSSTPVEQCLIPEGGTTVTLTAAAGTGTATVTTHDARL